MPPPRSSRRRSFPVILAGGGVITGGATTEAVALADTLGAPVCSSYLHNDSFPASHALAAGPLGYQGSKAAMKLIARADVVLALGTRLGPFGTLPQYGLDYWPKQAKIIQIDADPRMLGLVKPDLGRHPWRRARRRRGAPRTPQGTPARRQREPRRAPEAHRRREARLGSRAQRLDARARPLLARGRRATRSSCTRGRCCASSKSALPADSMVSTDIGNICSVANSYLRFEQPRSMFAAMSFGNCGYAFPVICGAKIAAPERAAFAYVGDGAWGISFNELLTCAREQIGVTPIVFNNGQWGAEKKNHVDFYSRRYQGVNLENPSWAKVARAFGCEGLTVERLDDVAPALKAAARRAERGQDHGARDDGYEGARRSVPARCALQARAPSRQVSEVYLRSRADLEPKLHA